MSGVKVLGDKNQAVTPKTDIKSHLSQPNKENSTKRRLSGTTKSRPTSLVKDHVKPFTIFEENPEKVDCGVQTVEETSLEDVADVPIDVAYVTSENPPPDYWKILSETRRQALGEALKENEELHAELEEKNEAISELAKENACLKAKMAAMAVEMAQLEEIVQDAKKVSEMLQSLCSDDAEQE